MTLLHDLTALLDPIIAQIGGGSIGATFPSLLEDLGILTLGLAVYGAVFAFVGAALCTASSTLRNVGL